jgi:hypothetical protein
VRAFLGELIDHAPLFPPARLPMSDALAAHERAEAGPYFWILGRFMVGASRLSELIAALERDDAPGPLPIGVVLDGEPEHDFPVLAGLAERHAARVEIETVEARAPLESLVDAYEAAALASEPELYVEMDLTEPIALESSLLALSRYREASERYVGAKVRCGGASADAVPTPANLANFVALAHALGVPFKATAGLHHPVRGFNAEAGFVQHGFLNLAGAAVLTRAHELDRLALESLIADEDPAHFKLDGDRFSWCGVSAHAGEIGAARMRSLRSYGSCSFSEPIEDLTALGILGGAPQ